MRSVAIAAALTLAGCLGAPAQTPPVEADDDDADAPGGPAPPVVERPQDTQPPQVETPTPGPTSLRLAGCENLGAVFAAPAEAAAALLPEGFAPVPVAGDPEGRVVLYVIALGCAAASVDGREVGPTTLAYAELAVVPPAEVALEDVVDHSVPLFFAASPAAVGEVLAAWSLGEAGAGDVSREADLATPLAERVTFSADLGGDGFRLTGEVAAPPAGTLDDAAFGLLGVQDGILRAAVRGESFRGDASAAAVVLEPHGNVPLLSDVRPVARGFAVGGFDLAFARSR